ncbi:MAG TPA: amidohydrolase family protein, partial [Acidimicrobiales bacterium]|nr:amidohydrolase family protein [Acidimicrobiales bacterium]
DGRLLPDEAIPLRAALDAFTKGVAYVNHREGDLGRIAPGYRSDIAVLDKDILSAPDAEIGDASVDLTISGGVVVYGDD